MMTRLLLVPSVVALLALIAACGAQPPTQSPNTQSPDAQLPMPEDEDHHHGPGPHGGTVADWGGGAYHVEFVVDHDRQEATVFVLDSDARAVVPIKAESLTLSIDRPLFDVELAAAPLEGETDGASSRFVGQHEHFGVQQEFAGAITGVVDGVPFTGDFDESAAPHHHAP